MPKEPGVGRDEKRCKSCGYIKYRDEFRSNTYGYPMPYCRKCEVELAAQRKQDTFDAKVISRALEMVKEDTYLYKRLLDFWNMPDMDILKKRAGLIDEGMSPEEATKISGPAFERGVALTNEGLIDLPALEF